MLRSPPDIDYRHVLRMLQERRLDPQPLSHQLFHLDEELVRLVGTPVQLVQPAADRKNWSMSAAMSVLAHMLPEVQQGIQPPASPPPTTPRSSSGRWCEVQHVLAASG